MTVGFPRDRQPELMDGPDLSPESHRHALTGLARLNRFTGIAGLMYQHLRRHAIRTGSDAIRVLDVAAGAADVPIAWAIRGKRDGLRMEISTLEISSIAIEEQLRRAKLAGVTIKPIEQDCLKQELPCGFDCVTNSLFMHHLRDDQVVRLVRAMCHSDARRVVICDLERSRFNLGLVIAGSRLVTRSKVVHTDAALSVRGAYTIAEFRELVRQAIQIEVKVDRIIPCRFLTTFEPIHSDRDT